MTLTFLTPPPTWRQRYPGPVGWSFVWLRLLMGVLNLAGLSIVGWVAAWRFGIQWLFKGCTFFQQVQKTTGLVGTLKTPWKKQWYLTWYHLFLIIFLFCFFWWVEIWSWWVDWVDEKMFFLGRIHNCFLLEISGSLVGLVVCFPGIPLTTFPEFPRNSPHNIPWIQRLVVFSNNFFCHPEIWGWNDPIWRAHFSNGLVQPPTNSAIWNHGCPDFFVSFFPDFFKKKNSSKVLEISLKNFSVKRLWFGSHECFCENWVDRYQQCFSTLP